MFLERFDHSQKLSSHPYENILNFCSDSSKSRFTLDLTTIYIWTWILKYLAEGGLELQTCDVFCWDGLWSCFLGSRESRACVWGARKRPRWKKSNFDLVWALARKKSLTSCLNYNRKFQWKSSKKQGFFSSESS